ncbi:DoxX family protein [Bacillus solimangrovi]|uniref:Oxidoreductase n=1 Tax=Bacillus solimangrovi TaxID=1305675 RepID=A0A1E5LEF6_9BACI|nr:DoxX family protein [Bacillus solimangrovi]OEH92457.1 oxidoreductase [Bacillus solimangrovi]
MNKNHEIGGFIIRIVLGIIFLVHGWMKFAGGIGNTVGMFESMGMPAFVAYFTAIVELGGGLALIIGLGTRIAAALIAIIMFGAIATVKIHAGFLGNGQMAGFEFDLALAAMAIYLTLAGSSFLAVDKLWGSPRQVEK